MRSAICALLLGGLTVQAGLSKLEAIGMIESGNNDRAIGNAGEVSRYQIMPKVWRRYTSLRAYQNADLSTWVAEQYLAYLESSFRKWTGREPDDFDRYVLWNAGPTYYRKIGFARARVHPVVRERARRFVNLRSMPNPVLAQKPPALPTASAAQIKLILPSDLPKPLMPPPVFGLANLNLFSPGLSAGAAPSFAPLQPHPPSPKATFTN